MKFDLVRVAVSHRGELRTQHPDGSPVEYSCDCGSIVAHAESALRISDNEFEFRDVTADLRGPGEPWSRSTVRCQIAEMFAWDFID
jgi:hypothetical protein